MKQKIFFGKCTKYLEGTLTQGFGFSFRLCVFSAWIKEPRNKAILNSVRKESLINKEAEN